MAGPSSPLTARELVIAARERSYRRARNGCLFLAIASLVALLGVLITAPSGPEVPANLSAQGCFWLALAYSQQTRLEHSRTLRRWAARSDDASTDASPEMSRR